MPENDINKFSSDGYFFQIPLHEILIAVDKYDTLPIIK